jgi:hypothetical protein
LLADSRADLNIGRISEAWWQCACKKRWKRSTTDDVLVGSVSSKPVDVFKHTGDQECINIDSAFSNSLVPSVPFDLILMVRSRKYTEST